MKQTIYIYSQQLDSLDFMTLGMLTVENGVGKWTYSSRLSSCLIPDHVHYGPEQQDFIIPTNSGIPCFIVDLMPDAWGKSLLKESYTSLDYLLNSPNADRFGNLIIGDQRRPSKQHAFEKFYHFDDLPRFIKFVDQVQSHQSVDAKTLAQFKTALAGAKPKLTIQKDSTLYVVKPADRAIDIATIESICLEFAKAKGMHACDTSLEKIEVDGEIRTVLLLKRFDRIFDVDLQKYRRIPTLSALSLLNTSWLPRDADGWSYPLLAQAMLQFNIPIEDIHELYKRMIFNALLGNDDDHPKNHAFYFIDHQWKLAPLYDVVPNLEFHPTRLALKMGIQGEVINRENVLSMHDAFALTLVEATQIVDEVFAWKDEIKAIFYKNLSTSDYDLVLRALN